MDKENSTKVEKPNHCPNFGHQLGNRDLVTADDLDEEDFGNSLERKFLQNFKELD